MVQAPARRDAAHRGGAGPGGERGAAPGSPESGAAAGAGAQRGRGPAAGLCDGLERGACKAATGAGARRAAGRRADRGRGGAGRQRPARWWCSAPCEPQALPAAPVVLPVTNVAEENGTFVNRDRRVQRYHQAKAAARAWPGRRGGSRRAPLAPVAGDARARDGRGGLRGCWPASVPALGGRHLRRPRLHRSRRRSASLRRGSRLMTPEIKGFLLLTRRQAARWSSPSPWSAWRYSP